MPPFADLQGGTTFDPSKWIGTGHIFNQLNLPDEVQQALEQLLSVPSPFNNVCTSSELSIQTLLLANLPCLDVARVAQDPWSCFCKDEASNPDVKLQRSILSLLFSQQLLASIGQTWVDSFSLVSDWHYPGSPPLPLWIIMFWVQVGTAIEAQQKWEGVQALASKLMKERSSARVSC